MAKGSDHMLTSQFWNRHTDRQCATPPHPRPTADATRLSAPILKRNAQSQYADLGELGYGITVSCE